VGEFCFLLYVCFFVLVSWVFFCLLFDLVEGINALFVWDLVCYGAGC